MIDPLERSIATKISNRLEAFYSRSAFQAKDPRKEIAQHNTTANPVAPQRCYKNHGAPLRFCTSRTFSFSPTPRPLPLLLSPSLLHPSTLPPSSPRYPDTTLTSSVDTLDSCSLSSRYSILPVGTGETSPPLLTHSCTLPSSHTCSLKRASCQNATLWSYPTGQGEKKAW